MKTASKNYQSIKYCARLFVIDVIPIDFTEENVFHCFLGIALTATKSKKNKLYSHFYVPTKSTDLFVGSFSTTGENRSRSFSTPIRKLNVLLYTYKQTVSHRLVFASYARTYGENEFEENLVIPIVERQTAANHFVHDDADSPPVDTSAVLLLLENLKARSKAQSHT